MGSVVLYEKFEGGLTVRSGGFEGFGFRRHMPYELLQGVIFRREIVRRNVAP